MEKQVFDLHLEKETKGAVRYINNRTDEAVTVIYLRKEHLERPFPEAIVLTIEDAADA